MLFRSGVGVVIPGSVGFGGTQPEGPAQIDYAGSGLEQARRQFHGYFGGRGQEDEFDGSGPNRFRLAWQVFGVSGFTQVGLMGGMLAVVQQQNLDMRVML